MSEADTIKSCPVCRAAMVHEPVNDGTSRYHCYSCGAQTEIAAPRKTIHFPWRGDDWDLQC